MVLPATPFFPSQNPLETAVFVGQFDDEVEGFLRAIGMAVERDAGSESLCSAIVVPKIGDT
jgi:hypothetical protein